MLRGIQTRGEEIGNAEAAMTLNDLMKTTGYGEVKQPQSNERAADHNRRLNEVGPDDGFDSTQRCIDGRQNDDGNR